MRRNYSVEAAEVILSIAVIVMTVVLFFKSDELSILYPIVFGTASLMCFVFALEGVLYRRNRMVQKGRGILFGIAGVLLAAFTWLSLRVVL